MGLGWQMEATKCVLVLCHLVTLILGVYRLLESFQTMFLTMETLWFLASGKEWQMLLGFCWKASLTSLDQPSS